MEARMTKDETLRLALDALESGVKTQNGRLDWIEYDSELVEKAITAIKEALAQPEHDYKDLYEKEKRKSAMWLAKYEEIAGPTPKAIPMAQPEQEPVRLECVVCRTVYADGVPPQVQHV